MRRIKLLLMLTLLCVGVSNVWAATTYYSVEYYLVTASGETKLNVTTANYFSIINQVLENGTLYSYSGYYNIIGVESDEGTPSMLDNNNVYNYLSPKAFTLGSGSSSRSYGYLGRQPNAEMGTTVGDIEVGTTLETITYYNSSGTSSATTGYKIKIKLHLTFGITDSYSNSSSKNGTYTSRRDGTAYYIVTDEANREVELIYMKVPTTRYVQSTSEFYFTYMKYDVKNTVSYNGTTYNVTSIGDFAFYEENPNNRATQDGTEYYRFLTGITIPNNVKRLGKGAFYDYFGSTINLNQVELIDSCCFAFAALTSLTIPNTVKKIATGAFAFNYNLETVMLGDNAELGNTAFLGTRKLSDITIGSGNKYYVKKDGVLFTKDMKTLQYFPQVWSGGKSAESPYTYMIPYGVETIAGGAFNVNNPDGNIVIPNTVTEIGTNAFYEAQLNTLTIPGSVKKIGNSAFGGSKIQYKVFTGSKAPEYDPRWDTRCIPGNNNEYLWENLGYSVDGFLWYFPCNYTPKNPNLTLAGNFMISPFAGLLPFGTYNATNPTVYTTIYVSKDAYDNRATNGYNDMLRGTKYGTDGYPNDGFTEIKYEIPFKFGAQASGHTDGQAYISMARDFDVDLSQVEGVYAYVAATPEITITDDDKYGRVEMELTHVAGHENGKYVPGRTAGTFTRNGLEYQKFNGVILKGPANTELNLRIGSDTEKTLQNATNLLVAAAAATWEEPTEKRSGDNYESTGTTYDNYGLKNGWFRNYSAAAQQAFNKCYLSVPRTQGGAKMEIVMAFPDDNTSGIESVVEETEAAAPIYGINGMRVAHPKKGVYVSNGKKVIIK